MKKKYPIFILLLFLFFRNIYSSVDFRNIHWNMNREQILRAETSRLIKIDESGYVLMILYEDDDFSSEALYYGLIDNVIIKAGYMFSRYKFYPGLFSDKFFDIKELLIKKYGEPSESGYIWKDSVSEDDKGKYIDNVELILKDGIAKVYYKWHLDSTEIIFEISSNGINDIHLKLDFLPK